MKNSDKPAFARPYSADANSIPREAQAGMTKRELFIAYAMQAHIISVAVQGMDPQQMADVIAQAAEQSANEQLGRLK